MTHVQNVPDDLRYTEDHEWIRLDGEVAVVGITDHAQQALGEITYVEPPPVGTTVEQGDELAAVESAKAAADVYAPMSGTVSEVNAALEDAPETVNEDPYGAGWICKLEGTSAGEMESLLSADQYRELLAKEPA